MLSKLIIMEHWNFIFHNFCLIEHVCKFWILMLDLLKIRRGDFVVKYYVTENFRHNSLLFAMSFVFRKLLRFIGTTNGSRLLKYRALELFSCKRVNEYRFQWKHLVSDEEQELWCPDEGGDNLPSEWAGSGACSAGVINGAGAAPARPRKNGAARWAWIPAGGACWARQGLSWAANHPACEVSKAPLHKQLPSTVTLGNF